MAEFSITDTVNVDDKDVIEYVKDNFFPGEVFPEKELSDWAENNGYIMDDE